MKSGNIEFHYKEVCHGLDEILASYDYNRIDSKIPLYNCLPHISKEESLIDTHLEPEQKDLDEKNLVFVCHLGVMFVMLSHLTGISPVQLWQGFLLLQALLQLLALKKEFQEKLFLEFSRWET